MKYGKRIRAGSNGRVDWCEVSEDDVKSALADNVALNGEIYRQCYQQAVEIMSRERPDANSGPAVLGMIDGITARLFEQCGIKGFVALEEILREKEHFTKVHALV